MPTARDWRSGRRRPMKFSCRRDGALTDRDMKVPCHADVVDLTSHRKLQEGWRFLRLRTRHEGRSRKRSVQADQRHAMRLRIYGLVTRLCFIV